MYNKLSILTNYINYGVRNSKSSLSVDTPKLTFKDLFATRKVVRKEMLKVYMADMCHACVVG